MRNVMVVAQVALALVLLIGAGLMLTSFSRLRAVDPGFRTTELVTVELMLPLARYDETAQRSFYMGVLERLRANPLTAQSAMLFPFPFGGGNAQAGLQVVGQPPKPPRAATSAPNSIRSRPATCRPSGVRLIRGRDFAESDGPKSPPVALISESAVKEFGGKDPIGEKIDMGDPSHRRRHRLGRAPPLARHAAAAGRLSALHAVRAALHGRGRPHRSRRRRGGVRGEGRRRADRSGPADRRRQDDGADHRGVDRRAALPIVPDRQLCRPRAAAGRGRRLRPDQLHRHAARAGDRRAAGARRQPAPGVQRR